MTKVEAAEVTRWLLVVLLVTAYEALHLPQLHLTENSYTMGMYHGGSYHHPAYIRFISLSLDDEGSNFKS